MISGSFSGNILLLVAMQKFSAWSFWCLEDVLLVFAREVMGGIACFLLVSGRGDGSCLLLPGILGRVAWFLLVLCAGRCVGKVFGDRERFNVSCDMNCFVVLVLSIVVFFIVLVYLSISHDNCYLCVMLRYFIKSY